MEENIDYYEEPDDVDENLLHRKILSVTSLLHSMRMLGLKEIVVTIGLYISVIHKII
jgi:hypothetical protein